MRALALFVLILVAPTAAAQTGGASEAWRTYRGDGGFSVEYPAGLFSREAGAPERGQGIRLTTQDGRALLAMFSLENRERDTPRSYMARNILIDQKTLIYRRVTERFFVVSSVRDGNIFYSRCNFRARLHCIHIEYPAGEKRAFDHIVTRISLTLE